MKKALLLVMEVLAVTS